MSTFLSIFAIVVSISISLAVYVRIKDLWTRWWWTAIAGIIGVVGGYYLVGHIYDWAEAIFLQNVATSHVHGAVCGIAIIAAAIVGGAAYTNKFLNPASLVVRFLVWVLAVIIGGGSGFKLLGLSVTPIQYVEIIGSLVGAMSLIFVAYYWRRGIQDTVALYVGYVMTIVMYATMSWAVIGINPFENLKGSLATVIPFVIFNTGLMTLTWIFGREKPFREMFGYKALYLLVCLMVGFTGLTTLLQLTGQINKHEHQALRVANRAKWYLNDFQRQQRLKTKIDGEKYFAALEEIGKAKRGGDKSQISAAEAKLQASMNTGKDFINAQLDFDAAILARDEPRVKKAKATLDAHLDLQKKYEDERMEFDDGYLDFWLGATRLVMKLKPSSKRHLAARTVQEKLVAFKPDQPKKSGLMVRAGDDVYYIDPTAPFRISGSAGKYHTIKKTVKHEATGNGEIVIHGYK